jgi:hypothetical protein
MTTDPEAAVLAKIAGWPDPHGAAGARLHAMLTGAGVGLVPRLWYGMPGYARSRTGPVLCFFRVDDHLTFGLTEKVTVAPEEGSGTGLMPCAWYVTGLDPATEAAIAAIVRRTIGGPAG